MRNLSSIESTRRCLSPLRAVPPSSLYNSAQDQCPRNPTRLRLLRHRLRPPPPLRDSRQLRRFQLRPRLAFRRWRRTRQGSPPRHLPGPQQVRSRSLLLRKRLELHRRFRPRFRSQRQTQGRAHLSRFFHPLDRSPCLGSRKSPVISTISTRIFAAVSAASAVTWPATCSPAAAPPRSVTECVAEFHDGLANLPPQSD